MTDDSAHLRNELRIFKGVANELGGIVQGVVDALGIRRDAERDVVLAELGRRLLPAEPRALAGEAEPDGAGPEEVWIPPTTDCMDHAHEPCPHCGSRIHHMRTDRCGTCGRRPVPAGGSAPADDDERLEEVQGWLHEQNEATDGPMYARTLGLVQDQTAEVEQLRWERDMALARVAAAEAVQVRMADSLPTSGPWESWSERDRAVRDYEGDLATALATETDIVAERLREVERERDEARQERDGKVVELTITRAVLAQQTRKRDEARAEVERMRPVVEAASAYADSTAEPTDTPHEDALLDAVAVYRAGGSAPHQGATTDEDEKVRQIAAATLRAEAGWWELVRPQSVGRTQFGTWLRGRADVWAVGEGHEQAEVRALLGAGETTEADQ